MARQWKVPQNRSCYEDGSPDSNFTPRCHVVGGAAGVCAAAAFTVAGDRARQGPQPRCRIGGAANGKRPNASPKSGAATSQRWTSRNRGSAATTRRSVFRLCVVRSGSSSAADFALDAAQSPRYHGQLPHGDLQRRATPRSIAPAGESSSPASIGREMAATGKRLVDQDLTTAATEAFGRVLIAGATARAAAATVETAPSRPRGGRQPPRRGRVTDGGCPATGRLSGTHARTTGAGGRRMNASRARG